MRGSLLRYPAKLDFWSDPPIVSPLTRSPYFNVAGMVYVLAEDALAAANYIDMLERKVAALEAYLDNPSRCSKSGVPITKPPS
jgi:hypothetical protein